MVFFLDFISGERVDLNVFAPVCLPKLSDIFEGQIGWVSGMKFYMPFMPISFIFPGLMFSGHHIQKGLFYSSSI